MRSQLSPGRLVELYTDESVAFLAALDAIQPLPQRRSFSAIIILIRAKNPKNPKQNFYSSLLFSNVRTTPSHVKNIALADVLNEDILAL